MAFMEPEVTNEQAWVKIDGSEGIVYLPKAEFEAVPASAQALQDFYPGEIGTTETVTGYGVRLSAPGFLDCTEWEVFSTEAEAQARACELAFEGEAETC